MVYVDKYCKCRILKGTYLKINNYKKKKLNKLLNYGVIMHLICVLYTLSPVELLYPGYRLKYAIKTPELN